MDRRKFLVGLGGASVGGAALIGSGAFTKVRSQRDLTIQTAEDPDAYLGLDECDTILGDNYVEVDELGHLAVDISENPYDGEGVNSDSNTWFDNLFQVCNQGKADVCLYVVEDENWPTTEEGEPRVDFYWGADRNASILGVDNAAQLEVGECTCIGVQTATHGLDANEVDTLLGELGDEITIVADTAGAQSDDGDASALGPVVTDTGGSFASVTDLTDPGLDPEALAESLVAEGVGDGDVEIVDGSVEFTGDEEAGGEFEDSPNVIGFEDGVILSSGRVADVVGPNQSPSTTTNFGNPGDDDLDDLLDGNEDTLDAATLEFEFTVPDEAEEIFFNYVFGSEEYTEYVGSSFNDVFGFFLNGDNVATVPDPEGGDDIAAAINNINHGYTGNNYDPVNPDLYVNNDPFNGWNVDDAIDPGDPPGPGVGWDPATENDAPYDTEMDGFTAVLQVQADVDPAENPQTLKLAIADATDRILDSWVLVEAETLGIEDPDPDPEPEEPC